MQDSVLERLLVVENITEIWIGNFKTFRGKVGLRSRNFLKKVGTVATFS
jgi:hypothetical protein